MSIKPSPMPEVERGQTVAAGGQSCPHLTADILLTGLLFNGKVAKRVLVEWEGGQFDSSLPAPAEAVSSDPPAWLGHYHVKILRYMSSREAEDRVRGDLIALGIGEKPETLRKHLSELVRNEFLSNDRSMDGYGRGRRFDEALPWLDVSGG